MSLGPNLTTFRSMAARTLHDRCRVTRPSTSGTLDGSGVWTPGTATTVYDGPCRVRPANTLDTETMFGGEASTLSRFVVTLPFDAPVVERADRVTVYESGDDQLEDRHLSVVAVRVRSKHVDRRLGCEEVVQ